MAKRKQPKAMAKSRLVDLTRASKPTMDARRRQWIDRVSPEDREQLEELKEMFQAGELDPAWSPRSLLEEVIRPAGVEVPVNLDTFRKWFAS